MKKTFIHRKKKHNRHTKLIAERQEAKFEKVFVDRYKFKKAVMTCSTNIMPGVTKLKEANVELEKNRIQGAKEKEDF